MPLAFAPEHKKVFPLSFASTVNLPVIISVLNLCIGSKAILLIPVETVSSLLPVTKDLAVKSTKASSVIP